MLSCDSTVSISSCTGEKPFQCKEKNCGKVFAEVNTLKKHMITHTGYYLISSLVNPGHI